MPRTPLGRRFLAVDYLRGLLEADHAFHFRHDWRGRFRFETASSTRPQDELIDHIAASLLLPIAHGFRHHDLGGERSRWMLAFSVKTPRGKLIAALAVARHRMWSDAEIALGLDFAATFGRIA